MTNAVQRPRFTLGRAHHARHVPRAFIGSDSLLTSRDCLRARGTVHPGTSEQAEQHADRGRCPVFNGCRQRSSRGGLRAHRDLVLTGDANHRQGGGPDVRCALQPEW